MRIADKPAAGAPRPLGRPRDPRIDRAVIAAALQLLAEHGFEGMSIEAVAQRAGVGKPTIYRRWPSKHDLVVAVLDGLADYPEMSTQGTARQRLTRFMDALCQAAEAAGGGGLSPSLLAEVSRDPVLREAVCAALVDNRRHKLAAALRDGIRQGELRPDTDVDVAADVLFAPLMTRRMITGGGIPRALGRQLVDILFDGYAARPRERSRSSRARRPGA